MIKYMVWGIVVIGLGGAALIWLALTLQPPAPAL